MATQTVQVELLGIARYLARQEVITLPLDAPVPARELSRRLADAAPALVGNVMGEDGALLAGHALARGSDLLSPDDPVAPGDPLLLLSTAAGG